MTDNEQIVIKSLPQGKLKAEDYERVTAPMPVVEEGMVLVKTEAFAITAGTRAGLQGSASYAVAPTPGLVMGSTGVGSVVESRAAGISVGDRVLTSTGWQQYSVQKAAAVSIIPESHNAIDYLGPLGVNGLTAYFGLLEVGKAQAGQTVMVSAAAGSVGHLVGQIAKIKGCHVVGVAGSDAKNAKLVDELGFDVAVNYKSGDYRSALKDATPNGVDVYFDNTGGFVLGSALFRMNVGGRIACCGVVSQYDTNAPEPGPKGIPGLLINKRIVMSGFLVFDFADAYDAARTQIAGWLASGELKSLTDSVHGLAAAPEAFVDLLAGGNIGTRIISLA